MLQFEKSPPQPIVDDSHRWNPVA